MLSSLSSLFASLWPFLVQMTIIALIICIVMSLFIKATTSPFPIILRHEKEKYFLDPKTNERKPFPSLMNEDDDGEDEVSLSVIVPAYNEEQRLPLMLDDSLAYLNERCIKEKTFSYEIIIVDDGSKDATSQVALNYVKQHGSDKIRVLTLDHNRGKGGAVRLGMLSARGKLLLFADADGATKFNDYDKLEKSIFENNGISSTPVIAIGSRAHLEQEAIATRSLFRTILMFGFHFLVWFLTVRTVKDTQCGFKLFGRDIAKVLFTHIHVEKWAFDVELLLIAEHLKCRICEIGVNWTEIEGSKVVPVLSWLQMGKDVALISIKYTIGAWKYPVIKSKLT